MRVSNCLAVLPGIVFVLVSAGAHGQCTYDWRPGDGVPGVDGTGAMVNAMAFWDDGTGPSLYIGGAFAIAGDKSAEKIARWDGQEWHALPALPDSMKTTYVSSLMVHQGTLIVAGNFQTPDARASAGVASWDGTSWRLLIGGDVSVSYATAITVLNGDLVAAGSIRQTGGPNGYTDTNFARWDGKAWHTMGPGLWNPSGSRKDIRSLAVLNGELIAGSRSSAATDQPAQCVDRWDGTTWSPLGSIMQGTVFAAGVHALHVQDGELFAGGTFTKVGDQTINSIARWDGTAWQPLGSGCSRIVSTIATFNGRLIAGGWGSFQTATGELAQSIAIWNGSAWEKIEVGLVSSDSVNCLAMLDGSLYVGGQFAMAGTEPVKNLARWNGTAWSRLGSGTNDLVTHLHVYKDELLAGGYFRMIGGQAISTLARWNGSIWQPMVGAQVSSVKALATYNGELVVACSSAKIGTQSIDGIARWNGSRWASLGQGIHGAGGVMVVYKGDLIVGGTLDKAGGQPVNGIARWDGSAWYALGGGISGTVNPAIFALLTYDDELIAGGRFTSVDGVVVNRIARWNGSSWRSLGDGPLDSSKDFSVTSLATYNGELIAGCSDGTAARWDGTTWHLLLDSVTPSPFDGITSLQPYNGELIVAGWSDTKASLRNIARWNGASWQAMGTGCDTEILALTSYKGDLVAGGFFVLAGGRVSAHLARWGPALPTIVQQPSDITTMAGQEAVRTVQGDGVGTISYRWRKDGVDIDDNDRVSGSTSSTLMLHAVKPIDIGNYQVTVIDECGSTLSEAAVLMVNYARVDFDFDGDVDLDDFGRFQTCLTGAGFDQTDPACQNADLDADADVDRSDLALFKKCMTGAGILADLKCPG